MIQPTPNLLRRTLVLIGVAAGFATATSVLAQGTVTLSGSSGNSCSYSAMAIAPNGNVTVTCQGGGPPPPPPPPGQAYFTISGPTSLTPSTAYSTGQFKVSRTDTNGPTENVAFGYTVTGNGCQFRSRGPYWLSPPNGSKPSETLDIQSEASGSCTITLTIQEGHAGSLPYSITVGGGTPPPPGCPTPPLDAQAQTLSFGQVKEVRANSGQINYYPVVLPPDPTKTVVLEFTQGQTSILPSGTVLTEFSISKCPGVIETAPPQCYYKNTFVLTNKVAIYTDGVPAYGWNSQEAIGDRGCFAPAKDSSGSPQQYYVNVRWTYPSCSFGTGQCGFSMQWAQGSNF